MPEEFFWSASQLQTNRNSLLGMANLPYEGDVQNTKELGFGELWQQ